MNSDKKIVKQVTSGIVDFLKKYKKEHLLGLIIEALVQAKDSKKAVIYTPTDLKPSEKKNISLLLNKLTGEKVEDLEFHKDESLIDGLKIFYNDKLWDFSVSNQINSFNKKR